MSDNDFKTIKSKYEDSIVSILEDAKRRQVLVYNPRRMCKNNQFQSGSGC